MAPPINPFAIMGKKSKASLGKGKGKGKSKEGSPKKRQRRAIFEVIALEQATSSADSRSVVPDPSIQIPHVIHVDESEQVDKPGPRMSRRLVESEVAQGPESSTCDHIWRPELSVGSEPILAHHIILDQSNIETSEKVAHALSRAAYLPEDMKAWDMMYSGQVIRHISRGLMMVSAINVAPFKCPSLFISNQLAFFIGRLRGPYHGVSGFDLGRASENKDAKHSKVVSEVMENATTNYKNLEQEYFRTLNVMKEAEEKARTEAALLAQFETEVTQLWEKVKKLESECIQAIGEAQEDGKR